MLHQVPSSSLSWFVLSPTTSSQQSDCVSMIYPDYYTFRGLPQFSEDVLRLCVKYKEQGVVGMDIAGARFRWTLQAHLLISKKPLIVVRLSKMSTWSWSLEAVFVTFVLEFKFRGRRGPWSKRCGHVWAKHIQGFHFDLGFIWWRLLKTAQPKGFWWGQEAWSEPNCSCGGGENNYQSLNLLHGLFCTKAQRRTCPQVSLPDNPVYVHWWLEASFTNLLVGHNSTWN